ncbi:alpha/beta hydrolase family esterase [Sorangium sp. So ce1151]|uniref:alpha/beta hydrolase family esterase n=1 Tax=Sorangium sp. So ce1151 TaxID=3133332 RepID=UPI003F5F9500
MWGCGGGGDGTTSAGAGGGDDTSTSGTSGSGSSTASVSTTASAGGNSTSGSGTSGSGTGGSGTGGGDASGSATGGAGAGGSGAGGGGSVTCPSPALRAGDTNQTVTVGSASRSYVLHVPAAYDGSKPVPLVVDFHPLGGSGPSERTGSPYPAQTDPEGVIMAFPSGMSGPSGGAWNVGPCCVAGTDDVAFAKALVAQIQETACIDPKRVYAVGFSMGGGMSHYLACHAADVFAAVAPAAFDLLQENVGDCEPSRPITVVSFRGTSDPVVPYSGGASSAVRGMPVTFLGAKGTFEKWADINGCTGSPSAEDGQGCSTYSTCQGGVEVALCTKQGGSHEPGNATVGWPVLKRHTMP